MSHVWEKSKQRGPRLLVLLAIADSANDDGFCWLGMPKLSRKSRQDASNTRQYVQQIEADGELIVYERKDEDGKFNMSNLYKVVMPRTSNVPPDDLRGKLKRRKKKNMGGTGKSTSTRKSIRGGGKSTSTPTGNSMGTVLVNSPADSLQDTSVDPNINAPSGATASSITDENTSVGQDSATGLMFYPCTAADIAALIGAWWDWTPKRPTKRGQVISSKQHFANKTNREYAQNLVQRGVMPSDFIHCLGQIRLDEHSRLHDKEMTFCYAGEVVEEWVREDREENWYTEDAPRITPRKPDVAIDMGMVEEGDNLLERLANDPNVIVDVPPPYISPHAAHQPDEDDEISEFSADDATLLEELGLPL